MDYNLLLIIKYRLNNKKIHLFGILKKDGLIKKIYSIFEKLAIFSKKSSLFQRID